MAAPALRRSPGLLLRSDIRQYWHRMFTALGTCGLVIVTAALLKPGWLPMDMVAIPLPKGEWWQWLLAMVPLMALDLAYNMLCDIRDPSTSLRRTIPLGSFRIFLGETASMAFVAIAEEVESRWLLPLAMVPGLLFFDRWMADPGAATGILGALYAGYVGPAADVLTFRLLSEWLFHGSGWAFGMAMVISAILFAVAHTHYGIAFAVISWFTAMYLWWVTFTFGLPAAVLAHFLANESVVVYFFVTAHRPPTRRRYRPY